MHNEHDNAPLTAFQIAREHGNTLPLDLPLRIAVYSEANNALISEGAQVTGYEVTHEWLDLIVVARYNGFPISTAPKDGTPILIHEPSQGGWIEARWEEDEPCAFGTIPAHWKSEHHCDWFSKLDPDLWLPRPSSEHYLPTPPSSEDARA